MHSVPIVEKVMKTFAPPKPADRILADIHLHAVLPRLADLVRLDTEAKSLAADMKMTLEFMVRGGPRAYLTFDRGTVRAGRTGCSDVGLFFLDCATLNRMFAGEKVTPIPFKGFTLIRQLKKFERLTEVLTRYLKPSDQDMADAAFRRKHVELSLLVGLAACRSIADHDRKAERVAAALHEGTIQYSIMPEGPDALVTIRHGAIEVSAGKVPAPSATIELKDVDFAVALIRGEVDTFAANGSGEVRVSGDLHLADEFNHLFDRVGFYLK